MRYWSGNFRLVEKQTNRITQISVLCHLWQATELELVPQANDSSHSFLALYLLGSTASNLKTLDGFYSYVSFPNESSCLIAILKNQSRQLTSELWVNYILKGAFLGKFSHPQVRWDTMAVWLLGRKGERSVGGGEILCFTLCYLHICGLNIIIPNKYAYV